MVAPIGPAELNETQVAPNPPKTLPAPIVLVVDDSPDIRKFLEIALRGFDFEVRSAANGNEAMEIYRRGGIDLVLMDVQMPILDGPTTLARLREINPKVVCCFMSADLGRYDLSDLMVLGAIGFLQKPFDLDELRQLAMDAVG